ncbi:hypothetical protein KEM56_005363 [Ascosphaera pollenicola]|nr:hypothetical protein KEM56_005363 [Ascosphaera pollenicola]
MSTTSTLGLGSQLQFAATGKLVFKSKDIKRRCRDLLLPAIDVPSIWDNVKNGNPSRADIARRNRQYQRILQRLLDGQQINIMLHAERRVAATIVNMWAQAMAVPLSDRWKHDEKHLLTDEEWHFVNENLIIKDAEAIDAVEDLAAAFAADQMGYARAEIKRMRKEIRKIRREKEQARQESEKAREETEKAQEESEGIRANIEGENNRSN